MINLEFWYIIRLCIFSIYIQQIIKPLFPEYLFKGQIKSEKFRKLIFSVLRTLTNITTIIKKPNFKKKKIAKKENSICATKSRYFVIICLAIFRRTRDKKRDFYFFYIYIFPVRIINFFCNVRNRLYFEILKMYDTKEGQALVLLIFSIRKKWSSVHNITRRRWYLARLSQTRNAKSSRDVKYICAWSESR